MQSKKIKDLLVQAEKDHDTNLNYLLNVKPEDHSDEKRNEIHTEVFNEIDCLECGNCCKTTPTVVKSKEIKQIAKFLGISRKQFERKYILDDLTGDLVISNVPCTFLDEDNTCSIYEVRPNTCRRYPLTDDQGFKTRPRWNAKNTLICPASYLVVEKMRELVGE